MMKKNTTEWMFGWTVWGCLVWGVGRGGGQSCISTLLAAKLFDFFFLNGSETNRLDKHSTELTHTHTLTALIQSSLWGKHTIPEHQHTTEAHEVCAWKLLPVSREHSFQLNSDKKKYTPTQPTHRFNLFSINFAFHCF